MARLLLDRGADVDRVGPYGETLLHEAGEGNTLLLDYGADAERADASQWTSLHNACIHDEVGTARLCLERGADIHQGDDTGQTLHLVRINRA